MPKPDPQRAVRSGHDHIVLFLRRLRLDWLLHHFPPRLVWSAYVFINGFVTIGLLAVLALVSRNPFVFPSLGPTAYLLFFTPLGKTSSPRNTICGHAVGLLCGYAAFVVTARERSLSGRIQGSSGQESWRQLFLFPPLAHSRFFSMSAILLPAPLR